MTDSIELDMSYRGRYGATQGRIGGREASVAVGRVELQLRRDSTMAGGGGNGQCALTKTQSVQPRGGGGRGEHGGAADRLAVAFLRW